jgi:hypothetical protein
LIVILKKGWIHDTRESVPSPRCLGN